MAPPSIGADWRVFFLDTYIDYEPEKIRWPILGEAERARLVGLPFWQEAVSTESRTSGKVMAAAQLESDVELRKAIELQGFEENRHARLLAALTTHYRIPIQTPPPHQPRSLENDFLLAGFGECFDSFFAFGLIAVASDSGYFTPELVQIFEPVVQEEARHILFFGQLGEVSPRAAPVVEATGLPPALWLVDSRAGGEPRENGEDLGGAATVQAALAQLTTSP